MWHNLHNNIFLTLFYRSIRRYWDVKLVVHSQLENIRARIWTLTVQLSESILLITSYCLPLLGAIVLSHPSHCLFFREDFSPKITDFFLLLSLVLSSILVTSIDMGKIPLIPKPRSSLMPSPPPSTLECPLDLVITNNGSFFQISPSVGTTSQLSTSNLQDLYSYKFSDIPCPYFLLAHWDPLHHSYNQSLACTFYFFSPSCFSLSCLIQL